MQSFKFDQTQQAVILGVFSPFIDAIACKVVHLMKENTTKQEPKFYTRKETAAMLHITLPTLSRLTNDGLLQAKKIGSRVLYDAAAIDEAVKEERVFKYKRNRRA
ncbi:excisionase family DNA binding protein [Parabacteroides sp. PFB2-10]|uniref:helix-turn-helix domain-containing protein n=1 Tax=Parabacteroides sp. PFB2-10 TaxID=1742405 RepID=UPI0024766EBF|nr:helix-turn-helix domain-containing protein [Parabacteroides sp. PFB2-10]MDH6312492.1 excisionase family DNA binding protein [Parabacteroides sp. PFB2-10]